MLKIISSTSQLNIEEILEVYREDILEDLGVKEKYLFALESGKVARYVTDFPNNDTVGVKGIVATPHLGASTEESEENTSPETDDNYQLLLDMAA